MTTYNWTVNETRDFYPQQITAEPVSTITPYPNPPGTKTLVISVNETRPGWLTGRRPHLGQLFPRGVYNK